MHEREGAIFASSMKILVVHNRYRLPGGEDEVAAAETSLLRRKGHEAKTYLEDNSRIHGISTLKAGLESIWSPSSYRKLRALLSDFGPDVVHCHNTFPLISPSIYFACEKAGIPVVQSLHNPRLMCPAACLSRKGRICELCVGKAFAWPGVVRGCYRRSRVQTAAVASMVSLHRALKTWQTRIDAYIVFTEFYRRKFIEAGLPADRLFVKPHFLHSEASASGVGNRDYALFVGRLDEEKGIKVLLEAGKSLLHIPPKIRGEGPLRSYVDRWIASHPASDVQIVDRLSKKHLRGLMRNARFLVWPSQGYYETFGLVALEAFSLGVPVLTSRLGVNGEIVADGRTGLHFSPGDPGDIARTVRRAWSSERDLLYMGRQARVEFETRYGADENYATLIDIYRAALSRRHDTPPTDPPATHPTQVASAG